MRNRSRTRIVLMLLGGLAAAMFVLLDAASEFWWAHLDGRSIRSSLQRGAIVLAYQSSPTVSAPPGWYSGNVEGWEPRYWWYTTWSAAGRTSFALPIWPMSAGAIGLAVAMWICSARARRAESRAGRCRCGYELAGLPADSTCPECGRAGRG